MAKAKKQEAADAEEKHAKPKATAAGAAKKAAAKTESAVEAKPAVSAAARKQSPPAAKKPGKADKPGSGGAKPPVPLIDTGLAAQTAAAMVAHRAAGGTAAPSGSAAPSQESSTFKNLKESLSKPNAGGLGGILGTGTGQKKFPQQFGGGKPSGPGSGGRNQTFGADVNRAGVPRRTGGG